MENEQKEREKIVELNCKNVDMSHKDRKHTTKQEKQKCF